MLICKFCFLFLFTMKGNVTKNLTPQVFWIKLRLPTPNAPMFTPVLVTGLCLWDPTRGNQAPHLPRTLRSIFLWSSWETPENVPLRRIILPIRVQLWGFVANGREPSPFCDLVHEKKPFTQSQRFFTSIPVSSTKRQIPKPNVLSPAFAR